MNALKLILKYKVYTILLILLSIVIIIIVQLVDFRNKLENREINKLKKHRYECFLKYYSNNKQNLIALRGVYIWNRGYNRRILQFESSGILNQLVCHILLFNHEDEKLWVAKDTLIFNSNKCSLNDISNDFIRDSISNVINNSIKLLNSIDIFEVEYYNNDDILFVDDSFQGYYLKSDSKQYIDFKDYNNFGKTYYVTDDLVYIDHVDCLH